MARAKVLQMIDQPFLGGGQMTLLSLAKHLDKGKFEVSICAQSGGALEEAAERCQIPFIKGSFPKKFRRSAIGRIVRILEENKIEIIHTHGGVAGLYGRLAARRARTPAVVHTLHGIHYLHYRNFLKKWTYIFLERYCCRFTGAVIFVSEADRKTGSRLHLAPEEKMHLIRNGVDFARFGETFQGEAKREDERRARGWSGPLVGAISRLHLQKGVAYLLRASARVQARFPEVKIVVAGGGPLEAELRDEARRRKVDRHFLLLGERKDAAELLSLFDVFVLPSLWEGLPYVLIEAAAMGKPTVATDIDGVREVLKDGESGILVPPRNPEKLARAIVRLLEDKDYARRLAAKAKETIPPQFALSRMIEETQNLYLALRVR